MLGVLSGVSWTVDTYRILSVSGGNATLDKPCGGNAAMSGGVFVVGGMDQFTVVPSGSTTGFNLRTAIQVAPSTLSSSDTFTDIPSTDTVCEGTQIGNVVAVFGKAGTIAGNLSYKVTAANGATVKHYVADLTPSHLYTLGGAASGTVTSTAAGVAAFTTTGSGSQQTVTLTA